MAIVVSNTWRDRMETAAAQGMPIDQTTQYNKIAQTLVLILTQYKRSFKIIQLGAGIKRITTDVEVCSKCNGTGRC